MTGAEDDTLAAETIRLTQVDLRTVDDFCDEQRIAHRGFLKIDTEGSDLDALKGAGLCWRTQNVDIVQVRPE